MKINVYIEIDEERDTTCNRDCPFLDGACLLFSEDLEDTVLSNDLIWGDGVEPTKERCFKCFLPF